MKSKLWIDGLELKGESVMVTRQKPVWHALIVVGLLGMAGLGVMAWLPLGSTAQTWLLLVWVGLFYGVVAGWIRRNSEALDSAPPALDSAGRPVIDNGAPVFTAAAPRPESQPNTAPRSLNQSEAY